MIPNRFRTCTLAAVLAAVVATASPTTAQIRLDPSGGEAPADLAEVADPAEIRNARRAFVSYVLLFAVPFVREGGDRKWDVSSGPDLLLVIRDTQGNTIAGLEKKVYPHLLRHTTATRLLLDGMPLHDVALFLGHESTKTTERYAAASTAALRRSFDQVTGDAGAEAFVHQICERRGERAAAFAADLLAARPGGLRLVG